MIILRRVLNVFVIKYDLDTDICDMYNVNIMYTHINTQIRTYTYTYIYICIVYIMFYKHNLIINHFHNGFATLIKRRISREMLVSIMRTIIEMNKTKVIILASILQYLERTFR